MPRDTATRRFQLTFNNPKEHDYSHEKIKSLLEAGGKIGYWCMGDEIGTQETYHTHLYVEFVNPTMISIHYILFSYCNYQCKTVRTSAMVICNIGNCYNRDSIDWHSESS